MSEPTQEGYYWAYRVKDRRQNDLQREIVNVSLWPTGILVVSAFFDRYPDGPHMLSDFIDYVGPIIEGELERYKAEANAKIDALESGVIASYDKLSNDFWACKAKSEKALELMKTALDLAVAENKAMGGRLMDTAALRGHLGALTEEQLSEVLDGYCGNCRQLFEPGNVYQRCNDE